MVNISGKGLEFLGYCEVNIDMARIEPFIKCVICLKTEVDFVYREVNARQGNRH